MFWSPSFICISTIRVYERRYTFVIRLGVWLIFSGAVLQTGDGCAPDSPCGRLNWLPVSFLLQRWHTSSPFLLHVKYTLSYRMYRNDRPCSLLTRFRRDKLLQLAATQLNSQFNEKRPYRTHRAKWPFTYANSKTKKDEQNKYATFMVTLPHGRQQHYLTVF